MRFSFRKVMLFALSALPLFALEASAQGNGNEVGTTDTLLLTLDDALRIAASDNYTVQIADKEIVKQNYAKKGAYAALFPQVDFSFNYDRSIKKRTMVFEGNSMAIGTNNTFTTGFTASLPLVNVSLWKELRITADNVELTVEKARASRLSLIEQVRKAYYAVLLAKDVYDVYKEDYDMAVENCQNVQAKYESGTVAQYDLIRAQVAVENAAPNVYDSKNAILLAKWRLKAVIGMNLDTPIDCAGSLMDYEAELGRVSDYNNASLANNSDLKQLQIQGDIAERTVKSKIAKYYPSLSANINYQWLAQEDNFKFSQYKWFPLSTGTLTLTIPIFSGGKRYYDVKQARVAKEQLDLQKANTERELKVQVMQLVSTMETSSEQFGAANAAVNGAEKGYEISAKRYEVGSGTQLELTDAQVALLQSKLNRTQSLYNFLTNKAGLDTVLGMNIPDAFKSKGILIHNNDNE